MSSAGLMRWRSSVISMDDWREIEQFVADASGNSTAPARAAGDNRLTLQVVRFQERLYDLWLLSLTRYFMISSSLSKTSFFSFLLATLDVPTAVAQFIVTNPIVIEL